MNKRIYIAADVHLGVPDAQTSRDRERKFVRWLEYAAKNAHEIILLGDIFDFWFEYRKVIPKGYARLLGKLAALTDQGIKITLFAGNHDLWYKDYFPTELGIPVFHQPQTRNFFDKTFFLHHGDGLGPGDYGYKMLKALMRNRLVKRVFAALHPSIGVGMAQFFSSTSRNANRKHDDQDHGDREFQIRFVRAFSETEAGQAINFFVFGHRHRPRVLRLGNGAHLVVLGDWMEDYTFIEISENGLLLRDYKNETEPIIHHTIPF